MGRRVRAGLIHRHTELVDAIAGCPRAAVYRITRNPETTPLRDCATQEQLPVRRLK
jgi:hypothetical protein